MVDYNLTILFCNGYVNYTTRQYVLCGNVKIGQEWTKMINPFKYFIQYQTCPVCTKQELLQIGIPEGDLERILSTSG